MHRRLPPLNPLKMFEAAARHESFTGAAVELGVTQAAVSRQVAVLEGALDMLLFERRSTGLRLTDSGRSYLEDIRRAFDIIDAATAGLRHEGETGVLHIRAYTTFAAHWLIPRLPEFSRLHPRIEVRLSTSVIPANFGREDIHVSIQFGTGDWPGVRTWRLLPDDLTPVCAPDLLRRDPALTTPEGLKNHPLLHSRYRRRDWPDWLASVGLEDGPGPVFDSSTLTYQAAKQGIGIAMGQVSLLRRELERGELVAPVAHVLRRPLGYYLVQPANKPMGQKVRAFKEWLLTQAVD